MGKYRYFEFDFEPIDKINIGGSNHTRYFKAIDFEHALKQAQKEEKWRNSEGQQVYRLTGKAREVDGKGKIVSYLDTRPKVGDKVRTRSGFVGTLVRFTGVNDSVIIKAEDGTEHSACIQACKKVTK